MKHPTLITVCFAIFTVCQTSAQLKAGTIVRSREVSTSDSIEYYETDFATRQKSYMNFLVGTWDIAVMKKQSQMAPDHLAGVTLTLNADSSFTGQASCNKIWGKFSIKGTSIKFNDIASTKMSCSKQEEENWMLQLLQNTVSAYSASKPSLLLRDGSSNIIFEASRKKE